jgi:hypothetical protein
MALRYRSTENDIRDYLFSQGFDPSLTTVRDVELIGIQRPGWLQVFTFTVSTHDDELDETWFGVLRDDERSTSEFFLLNTETEQRHVVERLTDGLTTRHRRPVSIGVRIASTGVALLISCLALLSSALDSPFSGWISAEAGSQGHPVSTNEVFQADQSSANARAQTKHTQAGE